MQHTRIGSGATKFGASLFGGGGVENKSFADTLAAKLSFAAKAAQAEKYQSEADLNNNRLDNMDVGRNQFMEGATNLSQPQLEILNAFQKSGQYQSQQRTDGPPTISGEEPTMLQPTDVKPEWLTPDVKSKYNRARMTMGANMAGTGKSNAEQIMKALISGANLNRQDEMISGNLDPNRVAPAMAATEGKPIVDVTGSGIAFNPFGNTQDLNTQPFIQNANIDAKAKVDAALSRGRVNGSQLPAEAKMVEYYMGLKFPKEQAIEMARSRKNVPLRVLASEIYRDELENLIMIPEASNWSQEQKERFVEDRTIKTMQFLQNNEDKFGGTQGVDPMGLR